MHFFEQLKRGGQPRVDYPFVKPARGWRDRLLGGYLKLFNKRLRPMKPLALASGLPVYDLTQPPLGSEAGARVLRTGFDYVVRKKPARPINMVVMLHSKCNMHCDHCSARNYMGAGRRSMSYEVLRDLFDQFLDMNGASLVLSGGEPTLHPRLLDLVAGVDKSKTSVSMFTNGARVAELAPELRAAGLFGTLVSLDSDRAEVHDARRNKPGAFAAAMGAIEALEANQMLVGISTYISHFGMQKGSFYDMLALGERLGVQQLFVFDAVPTGALMHKEDWVLSRQEREDLKEMIKRQNANPEGPAIMGQSWVNSPEGFGCFAGFYQLYVTAAGDVCPCDFTPISFGNIHDEPLQTIWDRMRSSPEWGVRHHECRMQDGCFRARTIDLIPPGTPWPVPYDELVELQRAHDAQQQHRCACGGSTPPA